ncbi:MAG TPA: DUF972 family protein [Syntrophothermus lipocalidus]|nr:DUF972 family protein [Syntrophothermus sp.]HHV76927.1 DUF972 family protein [Syntrophothermus lipocalidus]
MMEKRMNELKLLLWELLGELSELRERVSLLEQRLNVPASGETDTRATVGDGQNLVDLYLEGYHVCPMAYGRVREEECLFCVVFLAKSGGQNELSGR